MDLRPNILKDFKHSIKIEFTFSLFTFHCLSLPLFYQKKALRALWKVVFPVEELHGLISEQWKEMGWQGKDPSNDLRGSEFISLENLLYFARNFLVHPLSDFSL
ncbi:hypothetical protein T459_16210 [Capsicum annuum]|uniref:ELMO domain-containing protein n=1 Tax=Capsicum annuum TaxID=4072 RepID=A0A2G2Z824_CAPAN|nr:hypothetical protein T459_16210 [Capsicum annuum]